MARLVNHMFLFREAHDIELLQIPKIGDPHPPMAAQITTVPHRRRTAPDPESYLAEIKRVLNDRGLLPVQEHTATQLGMR